MAKISPWLQLDSANEIIRKNSEMVFSALTTFMPVYLFCSCCLASIMCAVSVGELEEPSKGFPFYLHWCILSQF